MNRISTCFASLLLSCALTAQAQQYQLNSPDGKLIVNIEAGQTLNWGDCPRRYHRSFAFRHCHAMHRS